MNMESIKFKTECCYTLCGKRFSFPFLSLDAHNHVDDYSGTLALGGVRKVHISALVTSP